MIKLKIIYNPSSGMNLIPFRVEKLDSALRDLGFIPSVYTTNGVDDKDHVLSTLIHDEIDGLVIVGGDGTVNMVVDALMKSGKDLPIIIYPNGTVNGFANYLGMSNDISGFCRDLKHGYIKTVDVGKINDSYFLSVVAGGHISTAVHNTPVTLKSYFGQVAYYLEIFRVLSEKGISTVNIDIATDEFFLNLDTYLFFVSNIPEVAGIELAPLADLTDGLLDCIFIKKSEFWNIPDLLFKVLNGETTTNKDILYFKTKNITITSKETDIEIDKDGEYITNLPVTISVIPKTLRVIVPQ